MEPSPLSDGDVDELNRRATEYQLQWSRRLSATETARRASDSARHLALQWSRRLSATETRRRRGLPRYCPRFNGAVASQRRRRATRSYSRAYLRLLQWSRRLSATE